MNPELIQTLLPVAITHLVVFLLFVWLLKIWAVGPVLKLIDERRDKISGQFDQVAAAEKRVAGLKDEYDGRILKIDEEARKRMLEEINNGRRIAEEISDNARLEANQIVEKARLKLQLEVDQARIQLKNDIIATTLSATERLLREKLTDSKNRDLVAAFVEEMERKEI
jgi:F-type H+-transporting ATPase subunit b